MSQQRAVWFFKSFLEAMNDLQPVNIITDQDPQFEQYLCVLGIGAVANGVAEASWLRQLLAELHSPLAKSTLVYCDNVSAVYLSTNPVQHQLTKHVEIDLHFVRDRVAVSDVRVLHVPTTSQFADIFTKGLPSTTFSEFRSSYKEAGGYLWLRGGLCPLYFLLFQS